MRVDFWYFSLVLGLLEGSFRCFTSFLLFLIWACIFEIIAEELWSEMTDDPELLMNSSAAGEIEKGRSLLRRVLLIQWWRNNSGWWRKEYWWKKKWDFVSWKITVACTRCWSSHENGFENSWRMMKGLKEEREEGSWKSHDGQGLYRGRRLESSAAWWTWRW